MRQEMITESVTIEKINNLFKFKDLVNLWIESKGGTPFDIKGISDFSKSLPKTLKVGGSYMIASQPLEDGIPCGSWFAYRGHEFVTITKHETLRWVDYCGKPIDDNDPELLEYIAATAWYESLSPEAKHHMEVLRSHSGVVG